MVVAKGKSFSDGTYIYTCGNCNGDGYFLDSRRGQEPCTHCYNKNYQKLADEFKTARGQRYYAILKAMLSVSGVAIISKAQALKAEHGKVNLPMLGYLCHHFQFNFKALVEWLEECHFAPAGTHWRISESKYTMPDGTVKRFQVQLALTEGEKWYQETYGKAWDIWRQS